MEKQAILPFGIWLKQRRKALDLRQDDLAALVGCAMMTIQKIEAGERRPSRQLAELLAERLQIPRNERSAFIRFARATPTAEQSAAFQSTDAAPWRSAERHHTNLPVLPMPLLGRTQDVVALTKLLRRDQVRLLTLLGPPGIGKTSLAVEVATELLDDFTDGVRFVALAPIRDPGLVLAAIAKTLNVKETESQPLLEHVTTYLSNKRVLLVLDNFEQVLAAAPLIAEVLTACPWLKVLVTSRAALHLCEERQYPVPPLALPDPAQAPIVETIGRSPAVRLFMERAQARKPGFTLTEQNAIVVAEICARLEGLPLALELAAARIKLLSPEALLVRLGNRLALLTGGPCDLPARQQTLRAAIDWSYALLSAGEQALFQRLGVFVGGCTLNAAEAICNATGDLPLDVLDGVQSLIDKSLLQQIEGPERELRFTMLETIREYAQERHERSGETEVLRRRHAAYYLALVEPGLQQGRSLERLEVEHDNLRAALSWSMTEDGDMETGVRLAAALWLFWGIRGYVSEGRSWLARVLSHPGAAEPTPARAKALIGAGHLAVYQGDLRAARVLHEESLALSRRLGDRQGIANAVGHLGDVMSMEGDHVRASACYEESLALLQEQGDRSGVASVLYDLGKLARVRGDYQRAATLGSESLALKRELQDKIGMANALRLLGLLAQDQGDDARATALYEESLMLFRELGIKVGVAWVLNHLGFVWHNQGNVRKAAVLFAESLVLALELGNKPDIAECLAGLAGVAGALGQLQRAARLFGAVEALCDVVGGRSDLANRAIYDCDVATVRAQLGESAFAAARAEGRAMPLEQAITYALDSER